MSYFVHKLQKSLAAGGSAPRPPYLRRLGAFPQTPSLRRLGATPPDPHWTPRQWGFAPVPPVCLLPIEIPGYANVLRTTSAAYGNQGFKKLMRAPNFGRKFFAPPLKIRLVTGLKVNLRDFSYFVGNFIKE